MPKVAHLAEDGVKDVYMGGEIDPWQSMIRKFLVGIPLIVEGVQLHPHVRHMTFPARTIILIRGHLKLLSCRSPPYIRHARFASIS